MSAVFSSATQISAADAAGAAPCLLQSSAMPLGAAACGSVQACPMAATAQFAQAYKRTSVQAGCAGNCTLRELTAETWLGGRS